MRISLPWVMTNGIKTYMITPRGSMDLQNNASLYEGVKGLSMDVMISRFCGIYISE